MVTLISMSERHPAMSELDWARQLAAETPEGACMAARGEAAELEALLIQAARDGLPLEYLAACLRAVHQQGTTDHE
jgi:hypothetical protein